MLYAQYLIRKQENFNSTKKIIQDYISQFELRFTVKNKKTKNQIRKIKKNQEISDIKIFETQ